jgi:Predicted membrane protein
MNWYYANAGQQAGPVDQRTLESLIAAGTITQNTLVWRDGWSEWRPVGQTELASHFVRQPPPPPQPVFAATTPAPVFGGIAAATTPATKPGGRDWKSLYLSFDGRATRREYWLFYILPYLVLSFVAIFIDDATGNTNPDSGLGLFSTLFSLAAIWPSLAISVKRSHDRNRSGWFVLVFLIPIVFLWPFVELGFLRGTIGPNRFGPDPLAGQA